MSWLPPAPQSKTTCRPSGDQRGAPGGGPPKKVNCLAFEPSLSPTQISQLPERPELKTILFPSGENCWHSWPSVEAISLVGGLARPGALVTSNRQMSGCPDHLT